MRAETADLLYAAIDELNAQSAEGVIVEKSPDAALLGSDKGVDSLAFINLIVAIEEQIQRRTGTSIVLIDEEYMKTEAHPFRTVGTLADYVERILDGKVSS